jgi:hypothetical protein
VVRQGNFCWLVALILACAGLSAQSPTMAGQNAGSAPSKSRDGYACDACHHKLTTSYLHTAHSLTSQAPDKDSILGSFTSGTNTLTIAEPGVNDSDARLYFLMEAREDGFHQTAVAESGAQKLTRSERIDIVVGSGVRGQTYLYWRGNQLYELPVSYWTDGHRWINSPGYKDGTATFGRRADPRCMECHTSYIHALSADPQTNVYAKDSLVLGISCETCHGPGASHVALENSAPGSHAAAVAILNSSRWSRDRQVDLCAFCHNGTQREELLPAFSYVPGEPLDQFFAPAPVGSSSQIDVHGNQVGLLQQSRCYLASPTMTCSTCHDVHSTERKAAGYSDRCLMCHRWQSCGLAKKMGSRIVENCIDCHMPRQETKVIVSVTAGKVLHTAIRNHRIAIYPRQ